MWAVLQQNWPNAFKKTVDLNDPGGVWAANLDDLTSKEMTRGLPYLQRCDDRYMPNAPTCRTIIKGATRPEYREPIQDSAFEEDPIKTMFNRLRSYVWMQYVSRTIHDRKLNISASQANACYTAAVQITWPYEDAWRTEEDKSQENWSVIARSVTKQLLEEWNRIIQAPATRAIRTYEELYHRG